MKPRVRKPNHVHEAETAERLAAKLAEVNSMQDSGELPPPPEIDAEDPTPLDEATVKKFLNLSRRDLAMLNLIASGKPPRNSNAILAAIKLKLESTVEKPKQNVGVDGGISITVKTIGEDDPSPTQEESK